MRSKWALPIQFSIQRQGRRFSEIERELGRITGRALSQELKQLVAEGLVRRTIIEGFPPVTLYGLTPKGRPFVTLFEKHRDAVGMYCLQQSPSPGANLEARGLTQAARQKRSRR